MFEKADRELCYQYPFAYLKYCWPVPWTGSATTFPGKKLCLDRLENVCRGSECKDKNAEMVLGEIAMVRSGFPFNDITWVMAEYARKGAEYFGSGCSCIVTRRRNLPMVSPVC